MNQMVDATEHRGTLSRDNDVTALDVLIVLAKHKRLLFGVPSAVALLAAVIALLLPNTYTGITRILPPQQNQQSTAAALLGSLGGLAGLGSAQIGLKNPADLYVGMLKSRTIADNVIERFKLKELYESDTSDDARKYLERQTRIVAGKDGLITLEFDDRDAKRAAAVANAYVEELDRLTQTLAVTEASQRRLFFEKQLQAVRDGLQKAEMALRVTQEATGLIKLDDQGKAIIESVARMRAEVAAKEVQLAAMRTFATDQNPDVLVLQQQIAGLKIQLMRLEKNNVAGHGDILVPTGRVPEAGLEYMRRFRDVKYHETMFEVLAKQYELARIDEAKDAGIVQVVDKAVEPQRKSKPLRATIVVVSSLVGLILATIAAFLREAAEKARVDPQHAARLGMLRRYAWGK